MNEQVVVKEAYVFLDEKRLLLASELLRQLRRYQQASQELDELQAKARTAMEAAVRFHGLDGLQVYTAGSADDLEWVQTTRNFMGVTLVETEVKAGNGHAVPATAVNPSGAAERCRNLFKSLLEKSAVLAGLSGNLYRLLSEYRVTERRSRALENIILPEIDQALGEMRSHLEELDLEDAIRVRLQSR
jgi:V/A-type H+-transporting ATPase subunit D